MESSSFERLSKTELLALEAACDDFEDDLRIGIAKPISAYIHSTNPSLLSIVETEFERIRQSAKVSGNTQVGVHDVLNTIAGGAGNDVRFSEGQLLGNFRLIKLIGTGATSQVWKAHHLELGRDVALKIPQANCQGVLKRFSRESKAVAKLKHNNIVAVHDVVLSSEVPFLVCDLIEGESLAALIGQKRFSISESTELLIQITSAVAYLHGQGVIHRDIKPQNILLDNTGKPFVTDFGLARILNSNYEMLTHEGDILGTPAFMSPEQAAGRADVDHRSDIYSLGVILFQLLTNDLPFRGNIQSIVHQILTSDPPAPRHWNKDIPMDLETICLKCLAKNPKDRFAKAEDLQAELTRFRNNEPIRSRPISAIDRAKKWMVRNPAVSAITGFALLLLVGLAIGGFAFGIAMAKAHETEYRLRKSAEAAEKEALSSKDEKEDALKREKQKVLAAENAFLFIGATFQKSEPILAALNGSSSSSNQPLTTEQLFRTAATRIKKQFPGDPKSQAQLIDTLGNSCRSHGLFDLAQDLLETGQEIRANNRSDYLQSEFEFQSKQNLFYKGQLLQSRGELDKAQTCFEECLRLQDSSRKSELFLAEVNFQLGQLYLSSGKNEQARFHFGAAVKIRQQFFTAESNLLKAAQIGFYFCDYLDGNYQVLGKIKELGGGQGWVGQAVILYSRILNPLLSANHKVESYRSLISLLKSYLPESHPILLTAKGDFANLLWKAGNYVEAQHVIEEVIAQAEKICPGHYQLRHAKLHFAKELHRSGEHQKAMPILESLLQDKANQKNRNEICHSLLWCYMGTDQPAKARKLVDELLEQVNQKSREESAWIHYSAARVYQRLGDKQSAELDKKAYRFSKYDKKLPKSGFWSRRLALILFANNDLPRAEKMILNSIEIESTRFHPNHPRVANGRVIYARILKQMNYVDRALAEANQALRIRQSSLPATSPLIRECRSLITQLKNLQNQTATSAADQLP